MKIIGITGKQAGVLHFCGYSKRKYAQILYRIGLTPDIALPNNVTLITFAQDNMSAPLLRQLDNSNIPYINAGQDVLEWNNSQKPALLLSALDRVSTDYVLVLDSTDTVLTPDIEFVLERYKAYNVPILFSACKVAYPSMDIESGIDKRKYGKFNQINSGAIIGEKNALKSLYADVVARGDADNKFHSDQYMIRQVWESHKDEIGLDYKSECFLTVLGNELVQLNEELYEAM